MTRAYSSLSHGSYRSLWPVRIALHHTDRTGLYVPYGRSGGAAGQPVGELIPVSERRVVGPRRHRRVRRGRADEDPIRVRVHLVERVEAIAVGGAVAMAAVGRMTRVA